MAQLDIFRYGSEGLLVLLDITFNKWDLIECLIVTDFDILDTSLDYTTFRKCIIRQEVDYVVFLQFHFH